MAAASHEDLGGSKGVFHLSNWLPMAAEVVEFTSASAEWGFWSVLVDESTSDESAGG
jgi:hypothetical protein